MDANEIVANRTPRNMTIIASHKYTDAANAACGILIGFNQYAADNGGKPFCVAISHNTKYGAVGAWATEAEARAHANRIHADKVECGYLAGWLNAPR